MKFSLGVLTITLLSTSLLSADWRTDVDWDLLQLYAGAGLPTGSGISSVEMVEADTDGTEGIRYMPDTSYSGFSGITFTNISTGSIYFSSVVSGHATGVAQIFYGHTTSLLTGLDTAVGIYNADDFINDVLLTSQVGTSSAVVMNHSYVGAANASEEETLNEAITRFDFSAQDSQVIHVIAMNNGSSGTVPPIWGSAYNAISVGRTDGLHSHGSTPANYPGPGRQKPDMVAPLTVTSNATPAVSSAATLLYEKATQSGNSDASHADTIKASLLAGATKDEFPIWSQTSAKPLDTTFGVGELNIFHSYRIIEKAESDPGTVNFRGWGRNSSSTSQTRTYTFTTPDYTSPSLSAALIWQRDVKKSGGGRNTSYSHQDLANLTLELLDASNNVIQTSDSALDNVEHIWNTTLTSNTTYSLKVSSSSGTANFSLAWQVDGEALSAISIQTTGNDARLSLSGLYSGTPYTIQRSTDLSTWTGVHDFTPANDTYSWTDTAALSGARVFYRLFFFKP